MGKSDKKYTTQDAKDYLLNIFGGFDSQAARHGGAGL